MSQLALQLIEKEKQERTGKLNLGNCDLTNEIPKEVFNCTWLEELSFSNSIWDNKKQKWINTTNKGIPNRLNLKELPEEFENLQNLKRLRINGGYISELKLSINYKIQNCSILEKLSNLQLLDLSSNQISDYSFLKGLTSLQSLDLSSNQISDYSFLKGLTSLQSLYLRSNKISDISFLKGLISLQSLDLRSNQISDISFLKGLTSLQSLDLRSNKISDISFLKGLTSLQSLDLRSNQISDISFLKGLTSLQSLDLRSNKISDISFLKGLTSLQSLDLRSNQISDISFLKGLTSLQSLYLRYNQISDITPIIPLLNNEVEIQNEDWGGGVLVKGNPITTPPMEIVEKGREAVVNWFEANKKSLNEIKIILIGDPKAGKTSILRKLKDDEFHEDEEQTDGINIEDIEFKDYKTFQKQKSLHNITGHFWDFGGQEIMNATHQFFLTNRSVYVLVLEARKDDKIDIQIRQWIKRIITTGGNSSIIIVANKIDINTGFGFKNEFDLQQEFPQVKYFIKTSCKTGQGITFLKEKLEELIPQAELFNTEIDERWIDIKNKLQKETRKNYFLNETRFLEICNEHKLIEKQGQKHAINFLHDLGLVLHFENLDLSEYYVLDPYWITYGTYQILTSIYAGEKQGIVDMKKLEYIVNKEEDKKLSYKPVAYKKILYSVNERRFLIDILHEFKLCFCLPDKSKFIIPDLLDTNEPNEITKQIRNDDEAIKLVYEYIYLPSSTMPRIIVETHTILKSMWRTGCVLQYYGSTALISSYQNRITLIVKGKGKSKREFMAILMHHMYKINMPLSEKPLKLIPLSGTNSYADYDELKEREKDREKFYKVFRPTKMSFEISRLLEGIPNIEEIKNSKLLQEIKEGIEDLKNGHQLIINKLDSHYMYLIQQPKNKLEIKDLVKAIKEINALQSNEIISEIINFITLAFTEFEKEIDEKLHPIYKDLKKSEDWQTKVKLGIPLLNLIGLNIESEFNLNKYIDQLKNKF